MSVQYFKGDIALAILFSFLVILSAFEYEILRYEDETPHNKVWNVSKFRINKLQPGIYAFSGQMDLLQMLGNESKIVIKFFYSPNGGGKMTLQPLHIGPNSVCNFLNNEYKKYLSDLPDSSNFPKIGDDYYCPLPKGLYKINTYRFDTTKVPNIFKPGYHKIQMTIDTNSEDTSKMSIFTKVTSKQSNLHI